MAKNKTPIKLTPTMVEKAMKEEGLDRDGIKAKWNLSHNDMKQLFADPRMAHLKNKKGKQAAGFVLGDDEGGEITEGTVAGSDVSTGSDVNAAGQIEAGTDQDAGVAAQQPIEQETVKLDEW